jgi:EmrB/QacA subfamily drug resistance transporter
VLLSGVLASAMGFINQSAVNVALPAIQSSLKLGGRELLWIVNSHTLMLASIMLTGGSLGDRLGRRRVFITGISVFAFASLACGLAPSGGLLIAARALQGGGGGLMVPGSLALITSAYEPSRRGRAIGTWAAATTITTIAGPLVGGFLAEAGLWRVIFLLNIPIALVCLLVLYLRVPESLDEHSGKRFDFTGAALAFAGLLGLTLGFSSAPDWGFGSPRSYIPLSAGLLSLTIFIFVETRRRNPLVPPALFKSANFSGANLLTLFLYGALSAYTLFFTLNLIQAQGYRESLAGFAFLPFVLLLAGISRWSGRLVEKVGSRIPLIIGPSLVAVGFLMHAFIGLTEGPADYWITFFPAVAVFGIGMGLTVAPLTTTVMNAVSSQFSGTASGINNAVSRVAGALAVAVLGAVALFSFETGVERYTAHIDLPPAARTELRIEAAKLGDAAVPTSVPQSEAAEVQRAFRLAFVRTFRIVMIVCTALAALSALMAVALVDRDPPETQPGERRE